MVFIIYNYQGQQSLINQHNWVETRDRDRNGIWMPIASVKNNFHFVELINEYSDLSIKLKSRGP